MKNLRDDLNNLISRKSVIVAIVVLTVFTLVCAYRDTLLFWVGVAILLVYLCSLFFILRNDRKKGGLHSESPLLSSITLDFVMDLNQPVVIVNDSGVITWYNKGFINSANIKKPLYGKEISECIHPHLTVARLSRRLADVAMNITYDNTDYSISSYKTSASGKTYYITVWDDKTELVTLRGELENKNIIVAFVVIDNFSEAIQFIQDKYRTASAIIGSALDKWCSVFHGIIKEYDRDKYFVVFEQQYYDDIINSKFDILDTIRQIELEDSGIPFTASIGLAKIKGTLDEKENAARRALDLALQRGGDQAVVKTEGSLDYYGGKSKTVQKKTKIRARVVANELISLMKKSGNVIVMGHKFADHDCIASCIATARLATFVGKPVTVVVNIHDFNLKPIFARMRGNKYYEKMFTDRANAQELVRSDTLLVVCDVNNPAHFEAPEIYENAANVIIIDHHRKTNEYNKAPAISYIEPSASSASEMLCEILEQSLEPGELTQIETDLLFAGLLLDTKQFTKNTGVRTFGAALYLRGEGANPIGAQKLFQTSIEDFVRESKFENNVIVYKEKIAIAVYEKDANQADKIAAAKASDRLLTVEGVAASFVLCMIEGVVHISARSDGTINVQLILESLHGGGHYDAAGTQIPDCTIANALTMLKNSIDKYFFNK